MLDLNSQKNALLIIKSAQRSELATAYGAQETAVSLLVIIIAGDRPRMLPKCMIVSTATGHETIQPCSQYKTPKRSERSNSAGMLYAALLEVAKDNCPALLYSSLQASRSPLAVCL